MQRSIKICPNEKIGIATFVKKSLELVQAFNALSVLKSHFDSACITVLKHLLSKSEKRFVHTLVARGVGPLGGTVCEACFVCSSW